MRLKSILYTFLSAIILSACSTESTNTPLAEQAEVEPSLPVNPTFEKLTSEQTGIYFINEVAENRFRNILLYQYFYNGGGVAAGDIDNDGKTDLFFTGNMVSNKLYRNQGNRGSASFQFEDISIAANILPSGSNSWCTGVVMADVNADGWLDIYVSRSGNFKPENRENLLYINQKNGAFLEQAEEYGLNDPGYSIQAAFFDYDRDGDLDMFLVNHGMETYTGRVLAKSNQRDPYVGDKLYRNDGGKFTDVSEQAGIIGTQHSYGLGLTVGDVNQDGWDDIYVANDFYEHDYLYLNNQDGTFTESIHQATQQISFFGMGVDMADFNNDLWLDIAVVDMAAPDQYRQKANLAGISDAKFWDFVEKGYHFQYMYNSLQLNTPLPPNANAKSAAFSNIARLAGVDQTDWSWAPLFADMDNDGWQDLFITNGLRKDVLNNDFVAGIDQELEAMNARFVDLNEPAAQSLLNQMPSQKIANYLYHNQGDLTFESVGNSWGLGEATFSNGAAYADLNNDGYLDLVINNLDNFATIYRNRPPAERNSYLKIKLRGNAANPFGIGAKVMVYQAKKSQLRQLQPTRGYQSSVEPILHFGLGNEPVDSLQIIWPDGLSQTLNEVKVNQTLTLSYQNATSVSVTSKVTSTPLFEEITEQMNLSFRHQESEFDDFDREFLLPHKLSDFGPALATADVNGDGLDDFFVGGASGQSGSLFIQTASGGFTSARSQPWQQHAASEATDALFFDADGDQDTDLYVVNGSNEYAVDDEGLQDHLYLNDGKGNFRWANKALPDMLSFGTCVAASDFDSDGDQDLFVGGYTIPGKYPAPARSYLLENNQGTFRGVTDTWLPDLKQAELITDAQWIELDNYELPALAVVGTWISPTIFTNEDSQLKLLSSDSLASTGWWFSLAASDWNQDGTDELVMGNVGLNYRYSASTQSPFEMYADDFDANGSTDLLFGYYQNGKLYTTEERDRMYQQLPEVKKKFTNYDSYAQATLSQLIGEAELEQAEHYSAQTFSSSWATIQDGKITTIKPLASEAQFSAVRDILLADVNQDKHLDIILAGNLHSVETRTPRLDAGTGLVMLGDGQGSFDPLSPAESGFYVPGDVRKLAWLRSSSGYILVVANNNGSLQLFRAMIDD
ncbi:VCBS repeat-containing protein [Tunicatimonas pelagia]|uniref:VCBS repeat-containing protein n=1 Tax=Tunicatimonas pelagia TaxID=931531 RepID=UPI0026670C9E|nr:VCBS repeat-containing protein [Tunicatimonas pelagia]WKN44632.1 VCBS repeat-containing protein [Tunicatimonas pelagia]